MRTAEENRAESITLPFIKDKIQKHIRFLDKDITTIDTEISQIIEHDKDLQQKASIIQSMPYIDQTSAYTIVAEVPELGHLSDKQIAHLIGIAPHQADARPLVRILSRNALYTAALSASQESPTLRVFFTRLVSSGKNPNSAMVAVMRKIAVALNAMIHTNTHWKEIP